MDKFASVLESIKDIGSKSEKQLTTSYNKAVAS